VNKNENPVLLIARLSSPTLSANGTKHSYKYKSVAVAFGFALA
jgi:hypothetical protein